MTDELARAAVGLPVALLWPLGIPQLASRALARGAATAATAALALGPALPAWEAWLLLALATVVAALLLRGPEDDRGAATPRDLRGVPAALLAAVVLTVAAVLVLDAATAWEAVRDVLRDDRFAFVVFGLLASVFAAGAVIGFLLRPLGDRAEAAAADPGLQRAGRYIGWLERLLVFVFLVGGEPGAAALALTAKSVARFPTFNKGEEPLAEYVLIGTLASFGLVTALAVGTRALLGLPVL